MNDLEISTSLALRALLQKYGVKQKDAAAVMGLSVTGISKVTTFRQSLAFVQMYSLCSVFKIDIAEVFELVQTISQDESILDRARSYEKKKKQLHSTLDIFAL